MMLLPEYCSWSSFPFPPWARRLIESATLNFKLVSFVIAFETEVFPVGAICWHDQQVISEKSESAYDADPIYKKKSIKPDGEGQYFGRRATGYARLFVSL